MNAAPVVAPGVLHEERGALQQQLLLLLLLR